MKRMSVFFITVIIMSCQKKGDWGCSSVEKPANYNPAQTYEYVGGGKMTVDEAKKYIDNCDTSKYTCHCGNATMSMNR